MQPQNKMEKEWSPEENLKQGTNLKQQGNKYFIQKNYKAALRAYHKAILHLAGIIGKQSSVALYTSNLASTEVTKRSSQLTFTIYLNMAQIYIYQQKYDRGLQILSKARTIKTTAKLFYRQGICHMRVSEFEKARQDFSKVINQDSSMKGEVQKLMEELRQREARQDLKSKNMFQKFFK